MASLTEIAIQTKKIAVWVVIGIVVLIILRLLIGALISYWKDTHPLQEIIIPPNVKFNKLPAVQFTNVIKSTSGMQFTLLNIEGKPPETTASARVYKMPKKLPSLLSTQRAGAFAEKMGFLGIPKTVNATLYQYTYEKDPRRTLTLDTVNLNFFLKYAYEPTPDDFFLPDVLFSKDDALRDVKQFIGQGNLFDENIYNGKITTNTLMYDKTTKKLIPAISLAAATAIRVDFFRQDIDKYKVLPPQFDKSPTYAIYVPAKDRERSIIELSYVFWPVAFSENATYPLMTGEAAWQDFLAGYAVVVRTKNKDATTATIRSIYLAYYDSDQPQSYLQPIFVFEGDDDFVAYLPAITSEWLE